MSAIVKKLLKSDHICQSYAQMKKGPVFFWLTVYNDPPWETLGVSQPSQIPGLPVGINSFRKESSVYAQ